MMTAPSAWASGWIVLPYFVVKYELPLPNRPCPKTRSGTDCMLAMGGTIMVNGYPGAGIDVWSCGTLSVE